MKKNIILLALLTLLFLSSCSEEEIIIPEKKDFLIETKNISNFTNEHLIEKTGIVGSNQEIYVSSQVTGRISNIYVKEGEYVNKGDLLLSISDNIANYGLSLETAQNNLDKAKLNYESTELQLNKSIEDLNRDLNNAAITDANSSSSLELGKIENSINRLVLDYENLKISNVQEIQNFKNSFNKELLNFGVLIEDILDFSDELLGISIINRDKNDDFENYLGVKNIQQLNDTKLLFGELLNYRDNNFTLINYDFKGTSLFDDFIKSTKEGHILIDKFLLELDNVLDNSLTSIGSLSSEEINAFKNIISTYNTSFNGNNTTFVNLENGLNTFLETYLNSEESLLKQIELLEQDKKIFIQSLNFNLDLVNANLLEAIKNKELSLRNLEILITDAEIGYKQAQAQYSKLQITSPINGNISSILSDIGEEITTGKQLLNITNNSQAEVEIFLNDNELQYIKKGMNVDVLIGNTSETGFISSISTTANSNLAYSTIISLDNNVNIVGNIVKVKIDVILNNILVPVSLIETIGENKGQIKTLSGSSLVNTQLDLGDIYGNNIEILSDFDENMEIIISEVKNYDSNTFNLKINNTEVE